MGNENRIIGLVGSQCTGKTYVMNEIEKAHPYDVQGIPENMDKVLSVIGYTDVKQINDKDWWLVEDLMLIEHYSQLTQVIDLGLNQSIICDRTFIDIAAYCIYYNEYIPDVFIDRALWFCKNMFKYTDIVYFPTSHIKPTDNGFRKLSGRESIDRIIYGLLHKLGIKFIEATSCLADRKSQILNMFLKK